MWQGTSNGDMEAVQPQPKVLPEAEPIRRVPVRDGSVGFLPLPARVGPVEPTPGRVRGPRMCPRHHSGRDPPPLPIVRALAHHLPHRPREGRTQALPHPRSSRSNKPLGHPAKPVGPVNTPGPALPRCDGRRRCHVAYHGCPFPQAAEEAEGESQLGSGTWR